MGHRYRPETSVPIEMADDERGLYDAIQELVRLWYPGRANVNRQALGFVMTHFRLRLGSSRNAFRSSLEDLKHRAQTGEPDSSQWGEVPTGDEDENIDFDPEAPLPALELTL